MKGDNKILILESIKTIINQFHRKPDIFLNEHDFHHYCYHSFYRQKEFSRLYETSDGRRTNILHPEYPTLKRFSRKEPKVDPKGVRARYDMAILNPNFIENNEFEKVRCRDISKFKPRDYRMKNLIAAMEFKFIIKHGDQFKHEILYDHLKLKNAEEAELKYMLVFTNTIDKEIDYFKNLRLNRDKEIKKIYVAVYTEKRKKIKRMKQYPEGWLDENI
jgi:hypothetical protein